MTPPEHFPGQTWVVSKLERMGECGQDNSDVKKRIPTTRTCGECNLCCKVLGVAAVNKPNLTWRPHRDIGKGCRIYETRPAERMQLTCLWLTDEGFPPEFQPTSCRIGAFSSDVDTGSREEPLGPR